MPLYTVLAERYSNSQNLNPRWSRSDKANVQCSFNCGSHTNRIYKANENFDADVASNRGMCSLLGQSISKIRRTQQGRPELNIL